MAAHTKLGQAFDAEDIRKFFAQLKSECVGPFCVLLYNARIHVSRENLEWYEEQDITVLRNLPYRPDLMGIEHFWAIAKNRYRSKVTKLMATG